MDETAEVLQDIAVMEQIHECRPSLAAFSRAFACYPFASDRSLAPGTACSMAYALVDSAALLQYKFSSASGSMSDTELNTEHSPEIHQVSQRQLILTTLSFITIIYSHYRATTSRFHLLLLRTLTRKFA